MQSMRVVLFLLICHIFLLVVVEAPDSCTDAPRCWTRDLHCQQPWERACNGVMCQQVCRRVALEPRLRMAMRTQRRLQRHLAVNTVQMLGTHNSHIAPVNGVGVEERYLEQLFERAALVENRTVIGNQRVSLWDQLEMGVRHLELDIHQLLPVTGPSIRVCHWDIAPPNLVLSVYDAERKARRRHAGTENSAVESASTTESASAAESDDSDAHVHLDWDYRRIGCHHKSPLFRDALAEIHAWLAVNREDVVTVYLDNRVFPRHAEDALEQVRSVFGPMLFTPKLLSERYGGRWPTMEMLMQDGYQVMFEHYDKLGWARRVPSANETIWNRDQLWREFGVHQFQGHPACLIDGVPVSSARYRALDSSLVFGPSKLFDGRASGFDGGDVERFTGKMCVFALPMCFSSRLVLAQNAACP